MIREYNHKVFENKQQQHGSIDASNVPASVVTHLHLALPQSMRSSGNNFEAPLSIPKLSTSSLDHNAGIINPSSFSVDLPNRHGSEHHPSVTHNKIPGGGNKQPAVMALSPESRDSTKHQFVMGSRVEFSDPPRYSEIRWIGNFPQVNGLIAGVELLS